MPGNIPTIQETRKTYETAKNLLANSTEEDYLEKQERKFAKQQRALAAVVYDQMMNQVISSITSAASSAKTTIEIKIDTQQNESSSNKMKRDALCKISPALRELGYQTCWYMDTITDDGINRDFHDSFYVSWDPDIHWNDFRGC